MVRRVRGDCDGQTLDTAVQLDVMNQWIPAAATFIEPQVGLQLRY
jgi:hypothetical protein